MAKKMVIKLSTGISIIINGWCDPQLGNNFSQLHPAHQQQYLNCTGQSTAPSQPPPSFGSGGPAASAADARAGGPSNSFQNSGGSNPNSGAQPGSTVNPAGAADAVDLNVPLIGPGGKGFRLGATEHRFVLPRREHIFRGIDSQAPESQLAEGMSPHSINFDSFRTPGSLSVRDGLVKMSEDADTLSPTEDNGLGIVSIPPVDPTHGGSSILLLAFGDAAFSDAPPSSGVVSWSVSTVSPLGRGIVDERNRPGPTVTLADAGSQTVTLTITGWTSSDEYHVESDSIVAVTAVYSTQGYPSDPEAARSDREAIVALDKVRWDGYTTKAPTVNVGEAGTYYFTVWAWTYNGRTKPTHKKVVVA